jgi:hypothetical protein
MKIYTLVFITFSISTGFTQSSEDTLQHLQSNDSLPFFHREYPISIKEMLPDSIFYSYRGSSLPDNLHLTPIYDTLPNCSDLIRVC